MLKLKFLFCFILTAALILTALEGAVLAATETLTASIAVASPTAVYLKLVPWDINSTVKQRNEINFSDGATANKVWPGKTSWDDSPSGGSDDGFISKSENVGFNLIAVGPSSSILNIKCGQMKDAASGQNIPYQSADGKTKYFGFSARTIPDLQYLAGNDSAMQPHSLSGWNYTFPAGHFGYEISVYNLLKIPANVVVGNYSTTGSGDNTDMLISLII